VTAIAVHGAAGRMGRTVIELLLQDPRARLTAAIDRQGHASLGQDAAMLVGRAEPIRVRLSEDLDAALAHAQVVIDFSSPSAAIVLFERCAAQRVPAVVGTTGLDAAGKERLLDLASVAPVVAAPNFSVGVNILWALSELAVKLVGPEFDAEIVELHHKHKLDAPSGTGVKLAEIVAAARSSSTVVTGRSGQVGARRQEEIGVHAVRGGDIVGDHTLLLAGPGERLELTHRAHGREIFGRGAIRAAHWVVDRAPGLYDMAHVLGIR
jgi:4-hydroxy-tetrahydrodipicolinate reductase